MTSCSLRSLAALAALVVAWPSSSIAQAVERVAFVTLADGRTGAPKTEVGPSDVVVREDRVTREVLRVARASGPMPVAVLVDTSAAAESAIPDLRAALTAFSAALGDLGPVALVSFGDRPTVLVDYSSSASTFAAGVGRVFTQRDSGATLIDAVLETARGLARREYERAAIVVLSTSGPELSPLFASQALKALATAGASLHVVWLTTPGRSGLRDEDRQRDQLIDRGVRASGGSRHDVLATMSFPQAMTAVARILTHQFRVVYARPQSLIPPETLEVTASAAGLVAYATAARGQSR
jgi:von Willebrand factor type A domain